jgi:quercetin dioxygenase-like cupin family protein
MDAMTDNSAVKHAWDAIPLDELNPLIGRKLVTGERMMLAQVFLKKGAIVPAHEHHNEQVSWMLSGKLRFWLGEHADAPGDVYTDVSAGEVLVIPPHLRHRAEALEDTLDIDVFDPPRQDWLDGSDAYLRASK